MTFLINLTEGDKIIGIGVYLHKGEALVDHD
jgi:hypothetical protein